MLVLKQHLISVVKIRLFFTINRVIFNVNCRYIVFYNFNLFSLAYIVSSYTS